MKFSIRKQESKDLRRRTLGQKKHIVLVVAHAVTEASTIFHTFLIRGE